MITKNSEESLSFDKIWPFLSDYFINSEKPWKARLLLAGSIFCSLAGVGLGFALGWWCFPYLYAAFMAKNTALLLLGAGAGVLLATAMVALNFLSHYLKNTLMVSWRTWLTNKTIAKYLHNKKHCNYLDISREHPEIDNPEQRIQENIENVVESSLNLSIGFFEHFSKLVVYIVLLSLVGGSLSFTISGASIIIPQFMLLTALIVGITTSVIGYFISKSLQAASYEEVVAKSNLRANLKQLSTTAEEIAIEKGEQYYQPKLEADVANLENKSTEKLLINNKIVSYNYFVSMFQSIIPFLAAAPLYFNDLISLDMFSTIGYYFSMITSSISWFIKSFDNINIFKTSFNRIYELQKVLEKAINSKIEYEYSEKCKSIKVENLSLPKHGTENNVMQAANLTLDSKSTIFMGPSGCGKSTLFKAIAGTWRAGGGVITIPKDDEVYFLPQEAHIPNDTLKNVLIYPQSTNIYSDERFKEVLKAVGLDKLFSKLDEPIGYKSKGEKQRIAFARVILSKPKWLFLDEATASLDPENEHKIYSCIQKHLPNTTVISIAHRESVIPYHQQSMFFQKNDDASVEINIEEIKHQLPAKISDAAIPANSSNLRQ